MSVRTADNSMDSNYYDVTSWGVGNPHEDIGAVINSIIADIKDRQKKMYVTAGSRGRLSIFLRVIIICAARWLSTSAT
mgnify:CR=1 FL=1